MCQQRVLFFACIIAISFASACHKATAIGEGVVSSERVQLRQSTARVPGNAGELKRGDKVSIIGEQGTFLKVRAEDTKQTEGWLEKRDIINADLVSKAKALENSSKDIPGQATGKLKQDSNLRLNPSRDTDSVVIFQCAT